ncbi:hypothetical protein COV19_04975 [Candidatus Woesearchaeota archaeon CG10_big_fil_rev_8_21_14_0_10_44_13]|nr:MAG: hypothetical protein COV19_04975 [Candidatus Woesearchaeota archaeon CG10_big_fil_rev_8_21_14_0_10_44_13]
MGLKMKYPKSAKKSQASMEVVAAVGIITIIFIFMSFFAYDINRDRQSAEENSNLQSLCLKISGIVSQLYLSSPGTEVVLKLDNEMTVSSGRTISIISENIGSSCVSKTILTNGTSNSFRIGKGNSMFRNVDGAVVVQEI